jgi:paraquat-inducible protein B
MTRKINYFAIGMFILIGIILFTVAVVIFGSGNLFKETMVVETYFDGSVQGLNVGSPIKFRGIKIGEVSKLSLAGDVYEISQDIPDYYKYNVYVLVRCDLDLESFKRFASQEPEAREKNLARLARDSGLRIRIIPMGITGTAYLELDFVKPEFRKEPLDIVWVPENIYIPSVPGTLEQVTKALAEIPEILDQEVYPILRNVNEASKTFPAMTEKIDEILTNTRLITSDIRDVALELKENPSRVIFGNAPPKKGVKK